MKKHPRHTLRPLLLAVTCLAFIALSRGDTRADTVTVVFNVGLVSTVATPVSFSTSGTFVDLANNFTSSLNGLTFQGGDIDTTLDAQQASIVSLGTFSFTSGSGVPAGTFLLTVDFTSPSPAFPSSLTLVADIAFNSTTGAIFITPGGPLTLFFNGGELTLFPLSDDENPGPTPPVTAPVPEPATLLLLATGLAGVAGAARRRLRRRPPLA